MCCDEVFIQYHLNSKQGRFIDLNFETLDLHLNKIEISFYIRKNSDMHLRKIEISFWF